MITINVSTRDLRVWLTVDELSADQIAEKLSIDNNVHINAEDVVKLVRERKIQQKNIKRTKEYKFVDPIGQVLPEVQEDKVEEMQTVETEIN